MKAPPETGGLLPRQRAAYWKDSEADHDVKTVAFVLTSSSFAVGELIKKLQNEKIGGERLARASILQANGLSAKKKVDLLLQKQDNDWESF